MFVYGSLLPGLPNHRVVAPFIIDAEPGAVTGRLVDCGDYPALVPCGGTESGTVRGLWLTVSSDALVPLDALEDFAGPEEANDYDRVWVRDHSLPKQGWTYVWPGPRGCPYVPGDYWPDYWNMNKNRG